MTILQSKSRPTTGETLLGLGCVVIELADATLAMRNIDSSQALIELAMCAFQTAYEVEPEIKARSVAVQQHLEAAMRSVQQTCNAGVNEPSEESWPCTVV